MRPALLLVLLFLFGALAAHTCTLQNKCFPQKVIDGHLATYINIIRQNHGLPILKVCGELGLITRRMKEIQAFLQRNGFSRKHTYSFRVPKDTPYNLIQKIFHDKELRDLILSTKVNYLSVVYRTDGVSVALSRGRDATCSEVIPVHNILEKNICLTYTKLFKITAEGQKKWCHDDAKKVLISHTQCKRWKENAKKYAMLAREHCAKDRHFSEDELNEAQEKAITAQHQIKEDAKSPKTHLKKKKMKKVNDPWRGIPSTISGWSLKVIETSQSDFVLTWVGPRVNEFRFELSYDGINWKNFTTVSGNITTARLRNFEPGFVYHFRIRANKSISYSICFTEGKATACETLLSSIICPGQIPKKSPAVDKDLAEKRPEAFGEEDEADAFKILNGIL